MSFELPGDDGHGENKAWDRASIAFRSKKPYRPDIGAADLLVPNEAGRFGTFWRCAVCAFCMTALYVFLPLLIINIFVGLGPWIGPALLVSFAVMTVALYLVSRHETGRLQRLARQL